MKKYFQLLSVAVLGIAIPLLALETNLQDLAVRLGEVAGHLGGAVKPGGLPVYVPKHKGIAVSVIDVQPTFMAKSLDGHLKDGELPVEGTDGQYPDAVIAMNEFLGASIISQDFHPKGHVSWASGFGLKITKADGTIDTVNVKTLIGDPTKKIVDPAAKGFALKINGERAGYPISIGQLLGGVPGEDPAKNKIPGIELVHNGVNAKAVELYADGYCGGDAALPANDKFLWPDHSIQGSEGAKIYPGVNDPARGDVIVKKGTQCKFDSFSVVKDDDGSYTEFRDIVKAAGITDIINYGIATDYCVKSSVLHQIAEGFRTHLVVNLSRGVTWPTTVAAIKEMQAAGALIYYVKGLNDGWNEEAKIKELSAAGIKLIVAKDKEEFIGMVEKIQPSPVAPRLLAKPLAERVAEFTGKLTFGSVPAALEFFKTMNAVIGEDAAENTRLVMPLVQRPDLLTLGFGTTDHLNEAIQLLNILGLKFEDYNELQKYLESASMVGLGVMADDEREAALRDAGALSVLYGRSSDEG